MAIRETTLKIKTSRRLKQIPNSWFVKIQQKVIRGVPDFIGLINGYFVALELKTEKGKLSKLQEVTIGLIKKAGGYAEVVTPSNFDKIMKELEAISEF